MPIIVIKSADHKTTNTGKVYLSVVDKGNTKYSCWDQELWNVLQPNLAIDVEVETKGIFKNIVAAESVAEGIQETIDKAQEAGAEVSGVGVVNFTNRRCALIQAIQLCCSGKIELKEVSKYSKNFDKYLNGDD